MRVALVNPPWRFEGSIYFGCREPHLPLELGACQVLLEQRGHEVKLLDGHLLARDALSLADEIADFKPGITVVTTAPSYLFWRCAPPELRVPREMIRALDGRAGCIVAVGPHGSATPRATLRKLGADVVIRGECEEAVARLADAFPCTYIPGTAVLDAGELRLSGPTQATKFTDLSALRWPDSWIARHHHHHHRFDTPPAGPAAPGLGAEVEASRGCPYHCSFCAKIDFRDGYRRRDLSPLLGEIDALSSQGVRYIYFVDEIFLPQPALLEALVGRDLKFGIQTRIDLWKPAMLEHLGRAGCVSIEAGVESLTEHGRAALDKACRMTTQELTDRLVTARQHVPFVQANLIASDGDDPAMIDDWRQSLQAAHIWANDPVPMFPYPSSPDYRHRWGLPDDAAWERALEYYLRQFSRFSEIQDNAPLALRTLEVDCLPV
jgi:B12-binding domain/radical SAM domain protein of rhizo-twelve system